MDLFSASRFFSSSIFRRRCGLLIFSFNDSNIIKIFVRSFPKIQGVLFLNYLLHRFKFEQRILLFIRFMSSTIMLLLLLLFPSYHEFHLLYNFISSSLMLRCKRRPDSVDCYRLFTLFYSLEIFHSLYITTTFGKL